MPPFRSLPTFTRAIRPLWFPVVFAALLSALAFNAYTHPRPHDLALGVVAPTPAATAFEGRLDAGFPGGFDVRRYVSRDQAVEALRDQDVVAAVVDAPAATQLLLASASSNIRATYLEQLLPPLLAESSWHGTPAVTDLVPRELDDSTGNAMMFWGLPLLVVGFITSILLLPFAAWPLLRKATAIAGLSAASSAAVFGVAIGMHVLPDQPLLLLYGFVLAQAIGWICTGFAPFVKQHFVAIAATFVLILGLPSAGGTVPADLLPDVPRWLNAVMPLAQTIALGRATSYFDNHGTLRPLVILLAWAAVGATLMIAAEVRRRANLAAADGDRPDLAIPPGAHVRAGHVLAGHIRTFDGLPVERATVTVLSPAGPTWSGVSAADGTYEVDDLPAGPLHVAVVAPNKEPEFGSIVIHRHESPATHDIVLVDWDEPVATAAESHLVD